MKIEQITRTIIKADEGKLLVRKSDGMVVGEEVHLGYDYYDAGVALSSPRLMKPDDYEEIVKPEDYEVKPIINHIRRLKRTNELIQKNIKEMNELELSAVDALEVVEWFPKWGVDIKEGDSVTKGTKFQYEGKLYAVLQDHTILAHYFPYDVPFVLKAPRLHNFYSIRQKGIGHPQIQMAFFICYFTNG